MKDRTVKIYFPVPCHALTALEAVRNQWQPDEWWSVKRIDLNPNGSGMFVTFFIRYKTHNL